MAAASPVPSPVRSPIGGEKRIIAFLRELREEIQNLQRAMEKVKTASELTDPQKGMALMGAALDSKEKFDRNQKGVRDRLDAIEAVFQANEELHAQYGDTITEMHNLWDDIVAHWPNGDADAAKLGSRIKEVSDNMARMVYLCALLTVPERVDQNLATMRVGQAMDFHRQFSDEVPDEGQRKQILDYLALHPKLVHGLVNEEAGMIYKSDERFSRRVASVLSFFFVLLLPVPVVLWTGLLPALGLALEPRAVLLTYAAIAVGSFVHIAVTMLKQQRSAKGGSAILVTDWLLWVHVKETPIVYGIVSLWVGLAGSVWLLGVTQQANMSAAFFVGYSLDSFVDLFLSRFETAANAATEAARAKLKPA